MSIENHNSDITNFVDINISTLKLQIKEVEYEINNLENEKAEIEKLIHEFEIKHSQELGEIILDILKIRKERLKDEVKQNEDKRDEYSEAEKDYDDFQNSFEKTKEEKRFDLTLEEKSILKIKFRQASKLCHPDIVNDNLKVEAEKVFKDLNEAYSKNDLVRVSEILENLEQGVFISKSDSISEYENLKILLNVLITKRDNIVKIIKNIQNTDTYQIINDITDWDLYFQNTKEQLLREISKIQN
ncbi:MAG: hypothetical protein ACOH2A_14270 [Sphingobacteriaceae bacterium]